MNILEKINKEELEKYKGDKDLEKIILKSNVSIQYTTRNKDIRIFRGTVIAKTKKGIHSSLTVCTNSAHEKHRLTYKFLYYSPNIKSVVVDREPSKVPKRAKLYYWQERYGKNARI